MWQSGLALHVCRYNRWELYIESHLVYSQYFPLKFQSLSSFKVNTYQIRRGNCRISSRSSIFSGVQRRAFFYCLCRAYLGPYIHSKRKTRLVYLVVNRQVILLWIRNTPPSVQAPFKRVWRETSRQTDALLDLFAQKCG